MNHQVLEEYKSLPITITVINITPLTHNKVRLTSVISNDIIT